MKLTPEQLAELRDFVNSGECPRILGDPLGQLLAHIAAVEAERDKYRANLDRIAEDDGGSDYTQCKGCGCVFPLSYSEDWGQPGIGGAWLEDTGDAWCPECWAARQAEFAKDHWSCCNYWIPNGEKCHECGAAHDAMEKEV